MIQIWLEIDLEIEVSQKEYTYYINVSVVTNEVPKGDHYELPQWPIIERKK